MSASQKQDLATYDLTAPAILCHPQLFEAKAFIGPNGKAQGEPKYSAVFMFEPESPDFLAMKALAAKIARERFPGRALNTLKFPFQSGDAAADARNAKQATKGKSPDGDWSRGKVLMKASSQFPIGLAGIENGKAVDYDTEAQRTAAQSKFFFGAKVFAGFIFVTHEVGSNTPGVTAYLNSVLTTNTGTRIAGGRPSTAEKFKGYIGSISQENPTAGLDNYLDDEIPF
jgi:hypothetical protein